MKKYPHQVFLAENNIKTETLPKELQKRIRGFEELSEDLEHAVDEDHDRLLKKLKNLSLELEEDLYDEFEDLLENNDQVEEASEEKPPVEIKKEKVSIEKKAPTDEEILDGLYAKGKREISRSALKNLGLKTRLVSSKVKVGKYTLYKAMFSYTYTIKKN